MDDLLELFHAYRATQHHTREAADALAIAVAEAREQHTVRAIAAALGVGSSTVQDLTRRGRELRKG